MSSEKYNLMDMAFAIPVRIDSVGRIENVLASIGNLTRSFDTNIFILEAAPFNNHILERLLPSGVSYIFVRDIDPVFHRTKYINQIVAKSATRHIAIWDADVILDPEQIKAAVAQLREGKCDVAFPFDGCFYDTTEIIRNIYLEREDLSVLSDNIGKMQLPYGTDMGGGAIFITREKFHAAGGEDERFYGWGPEDWNRLEKWKKLGYRLKKIDGPLYHLTHPRDMNGKHNSDWQRRYSHNILRKTKQSSKEDLLELAGPAYDELQSRSTKLHIGCGYCLLSGWLNTDIAPSSDEVMYMDVTKPLPFPDNTFEYVYAEHVLEHITFDALASALHEIFRVLKRDGVLRIAMPSLDFLMRLYGSPETSSHARYLAWSIDAFASRTAKGVRVSPKAKAAIVLNNFMHNWGHQFIHNDVLLENLLQCTGFVKVERCAVGQSRHGDLRGIERHDSQIPTWANEMETMVLEATKPSGQ